MSESLDPGDPDPPQVLENATEYQEEKRALAPSTEKTAEIVVPDGSGSENERSHQQNISSDSAEDAETDKEEKKEEEFLQDEEIKSDLKEETEAETENDVSIDEIDEVDLEQQSSPDNYDSDDLDDSDNEDFNDGTLSSTIIREIQDGTYVCLVCTGEIDSDSKIWSCESCYRVYDLDCIKDWAQRGSSTDKTSKEWRCPACNVATKKIPSRFTCWCGKVQNPQPSLIPFSCGNSCNSKYEGCIHSCSSICHPGAHPMCGAMGPLMKCQCGKEARQLPCLITPYKKGWECETPCGVTVCDLGHDCKRGCHSGFCGVCEETLTIKCYCGKENLTLKCHEKTLMSCQGLDCDGQSSWIGGGTCKQKSRVYYNCKIHFDDLDCQPLPLETKICKLDPSQIATCYCGKTHVEAQGRTKCTDPIPECNSRCDKLLACGCRCLLKCHPGECECFAKKDIKCSCGHEVFTVRCKFIQDGYVPRCKHKCSVLLSCRKHYHREQCCPSEQEALERERQKKKAIRNNTRSNFNDEVMTMEPVHICTRTCNRLKPCGQHYCEALCHSGPCGVCLESTNDDLICNCGKTSIPAPVRCGTKLVCHEQCIRPTQCGHRREPHECHDDSVSCPKCTALVAKTCNCGLKSDIPGILCSQENVSCGNICTVPKQCGHPCLRSCSSKCTKENIHNSSALCSAYCKKVRKNCPHLCQLKCHANKVGKSPNCDITRCTELVSVTCECGRIKKKIPCGSTVENTSSIGSTLECDEECDKAKRDAELRAAFNVESTQDDLIKEEIPYSELVLSTYEAQPTWCSRIENIMRSFVEDYHHQLDNGVKSPKRTYHFPAMTSPQRAFIHELGEALKLYVESQDKEPKRSVFIVITRVTQLPEMTVGRAIIHKKELINEANKASEIKQKDIESHYYNAIVIQDVFFGIVKDDLERELSNYVNGSHVKYPVFQWIKDSTFVFYSEASFQNISLEEENELYLLAKTFRKVVREKSLAFDCKLCYIDDEAAYILKIEGTSSTPSREPTPHPLSRHSNGFEVLNDDSAQIEA
ncbi:putative transcriptional repressor [Scheffersomyces xylosifermentans]|uniref:putative transcriptional repressor n=1 Tax=Scheffersomyces xylosifermentans TaxID=1304137 RepID=UPI00315D8489